MSLTSDLSRLDEAHSILTTLIEQGYSSSVLFTISSVLSQVPALDKASNDPHFWQQVVVQLNETADTLSREEIKEDLLSGDVPREYWDTFGQDFFDGEDADDLDSPN
jgi:hypothetical protein